MNELAEQYDGKMDFEVLLTTAPGAAEHIRELGFDKHGMVITDAQDKVLWKEDGHTQKKPAIQSQIDKLLKAE